MNILFMGTPDFALFSLRALVDAGEDTVIGVVTQPDTPKGRGYVLTPPPVKVYAEAHGIPVYQPATLKGDGFAQTLSALAPDLIVVAAYGKILPKNVLDFPKYGCINVHGSLLPRYRGAAPMQRAIIDGEPVTGVTIMYMAEGLDTGDMLLKAEVPIAPDDDFEAVHDKLGEAGADALLRAIRSLKDGTAVRTPQEDALATYAAKITKDDCHIDFSAPAGKVHDRIRGLSPMPLAFTHTPDGKMLKVLASAVADGKATAAAGNAGAENAMKKNAAAADTGAENTAAQTAAPGTVLSLEGGKITVACGDGRNVALLRVLPEGKGRMSAADFINGRKIAVGDILA